MSLSRRSLLVSLLVHCFLAGAVIFLIKNQEVKKIQSPEGSKIEVVSRPVQLRTRPPKVSASKAPSDSTQLLAGTRDEKTKVQTEHLNEVSKERVPNQPTRPKPRLIDRTNQYPQAPSNNRKGAPSPKSTPHKIVPKEQSTPLGSDWGIRSSPSATESGEGGKQSTVTRRARPVSRPEFDLGKRFPGLQSVTVKARFEINEDGSYEPTLITTTGNPTADVVIIGRLLEFKWLPALDKGVPIKDVRVIDISLEN